jgi:hypothetical protein
MNASSRYLDLNWPDPTPVMARKKMDITSKTPHHGV